MFGTKRWEGDAAAWSSAKEQATEVSADACEHGSRPEIGAGALWVCGVKAYPDQEPLEQVAGVQQEGAVD